MTFTEKTGEIQPWENLPAGEYGIVELFGHTTLVGLITEVERFGAKMMVIRPLFNGALLPDVFHGGAAIYRFTPCSAQIAWERQPRQEYHLPSTIRCIVPAAALPGTVDMSDNGPQQDGYDDDEPF